MIEKAIQDKNNGIPLSPYECHNRVKNMYNWRNIAKRTERVNYIIPIVLISCW